MLISSQPDEVGNSHRQAQRQTWVTSGRTHQPRGGMPPARLACPPRCLRCSRLHSRRTAREGEHPQRVGGVVGGAAAMQGFLRVAPRGAAAPKRSADIAPAAVPRWGRVSCRTGWRPWMDCTVVLLYFLRAPTGAMRERGRSRRSSSTNTSLRVPAERRRGPRCSSEQLGPSAFGPPTFSEGRG